ncbi:hypothetical protein ACEPAG_1707 [Sanghuangporus baumii]
MSPSSGSIRSRTNSPTTPLNPTDAISYGSAPADPISATESLNQESEESQNREERKTWQSRIAAQLRSHDYSPYLLLENSGSVARDHLASERTFLAYVRTSLALASAGVALVQLFSVASKSGKSNETLFRFARPLGATLVIVGITILLIGFSRYFRVQAALISGQFPLARISVAFVSSAIALLVVVIFGVLIHAVQ